MILTRRYKGVLVYGNLDLCRVGRPVIQQEEIHSIMKSHQPARVGGSKNKFRVQKSLVSKILYDTDKLIKIIVLKLHDVLGKLRFESFQNNKWIKISPSEKHK